jgi:hypothetical protein
MVALYQMDEAGPTETFPTKTLDGAINTSEATEGASYLTGRMEVWRLAAKSTGVNTHQIDTDFAYLLP